MGFRGYQAPQGPKETWVVQGSAELLDLLDRKDLQVNQANRGFKEKLVRKAFKVSRDLRAQSATTVMSHGIPTRVRET